jgi:ABC-type sulfate/molybdate transport systems ATPase subunit
VLSESVSLALEVIGLRKHFTAGLGSCSATNCVLRGVNLELESGEVAAVVGAAGSGRSTLLLCIAGLLTADEGRIRHFGDESREAGMRYSTYHLNLDRLSLSGESRQRASQLLDLRDFSAIRLERLARWLDEQSARGGAAIVVADSVELAHQLTRRVLILREGRLHEPARMRARVAEARFVDRPFERV